MYIQCKKEGESDKSEREIYTETERDEYTQEIGQMPRKV